MGSSRRKYDAPVAYLVITDDRQIYISNKYTAILMYELWVDNIMRTGISCTIALYAILPPTPWPTWSRTHIISLLNGCWKRSRIAYAKYANGIPISVFDKTKSAFRLDHYEQHFIIAHSKMTTDEKNALNNTLMYPQVLELVLRSSSPIAAKTALIIENMTLFPDGTSATKYIKSVWKYLKYETKK